MKILPMKKKGWKKSHVITDQFSISSQSIDKLPYHPSIHPSTHPLHEQKICDHSHRMNSILLTTLKVSKIPLHSIAIQWHWMVLWWVYDLCACACFFTVGSANNLFPLPLSLNTLLHCQGPAHIHPLPQNLLHWITLSIGFNCSSWTPVSCHLSSENVWCPLKYTPDVWNQSVHQYSIVSSFNLAAESKLKKREKFPFLFSASPTPNW